MTENYEAVLEIPPMANPLLDETPISIPPVTQISLSDVAKFVNELWPTVKDVAEYIKKQIQEIEQAKITILKTDIGQISLGQNRLHFGLSRKRVDDYATIYYHGFSQTISINDGTKEDYMSGWKDVTIPGNNAIVLVTDNTGGGHWGVSMDVWTDYGLRRKQQTGNGSPIIRINQYGEDNILDIGRRRIFIYSFQAVQ